MSILAEEFLDSARINIGEAREIDLRNAISRAYYAMFHLASEAERLCPVVPAGRSGVHAALIKRFSSTPRKGFPGGSKARQVGVLLGYARTHRVTADYHLTCDVAAAALREQIGYAEKVQDLVQELVTLHDARK